jgi:hypothetical protein
MCRVGSSCIGRSLVAGVAVSATGSR